MAAQADDELFLELTARFGMHTRFGGRTFFLPVSHRSWPLHRAGLVHLDDGLLGAVGLDVAGPPESVLFSPGVDTVFGRPRGCRCPERILPGAGSEPPERTGPHRWYCCRRGPEMVSGAGTSREPPMAQGGQRHSG